jgi:hypothetical protein
MKIDAQAIAKEETKKQFIQAHNLKYWQNLSCDTKMGAYVSKLQKKKNLKAQEA